MRLNCFHDHRPQFSIIVLPFIFFLRNSFNEKVIRVWDFLLIFNGRKVDNNILPLLAYSPHFCFKIQWLYCSLSYTTICMFSLFSSLKHSYLATFISLSLRLLKEVENCETLYSKKFLGPSNAMIKRKCELDRYLLAYALESFHFCCENVFLIFFFF